jgi:plastocyanin
LSITWTRRLRATRVGVIAAALLLGGLSSIGVGRAARGDDGGRAAAAIGAVVRVRGNNFLEPNRFIKNTFHFDPGRVSVQRGEDIKFADVAAAKEPHTITLVKRGQLPGTVEEAFSCRPCGRALQRHGRPPKKVVEDDRDRETGLDAPGDSRWLPPGGKIRPTVTARAGTTLYYLCAIHPWMQGRIDVN